MMPRAGGVTMKLPDPPDDHLESRSISGVLSTIATGLVPVAMGVSGIAIDWLDQQVPPLWYMCSGVMVLMMIYLGRSTDFRQYLNSPLKSDQVGQP